MKRIEPRATLCWIVIATGWLATGCLGTTHHALAVSHVGPTSARSSPQTPQRPANTAAREFDLGTTAYARGQKQEAIAHFEAALRMAPNPAVLFNLARVHDELHHDEAAARAYAAFLATDADRYATAARDAMTALTRLSTRVAWVVVRGDPAAAMDGSSSAELRRGVPMAIAPGAHVLRACSGGATFDLALHAGDVLEFGCGSPRGISLETASFEDLQFVNTRELHAAR